MGKAHSMLDSALAYLQAGRSVVNAHARGSGPCPCRLLMPAASHRRQTLHAGKGVCA